MSKLIDEIKVPDVEKTKEEMFNVWTCIFSKIDKKYCSTKIISPEDVKIIEALVIQMQFSKGREKIWKDFGYNPRGKSDQEMMKRRLFKLVNNLKIRQQQNPNLAIGNHIGEELHHIAREEKEQKEEIKEY